MLRPEKLVESVRKRLRISLIGREVCRYGAYASVVALLILIASKFIHIQSLQHIAAGIVAFGIFAGIFSAFKRKITVLDAAMVADLKADTGETLTTYYELAANPTIFEKRIKKNAENTSKELNPAVIIPYHFPRSIRFLIPLLLLAVGMGFVPEFKYPAQKNREKNRIELAQSAKKLDKASKIITETKSENQEVKELQKELKELQAKIKRGDIDRKRAMAEMKKISDKLETLLRENYSKKAEAENTADALSKNEDTKDLGEAMKKGDKKAIEQKASELAKRLDEMQKGLKSEDAAERESAQKRIEDIKNALETAKKGSENGKLSEELQNALDSLSKMPAGASTQDIPKEMLDKLAKNMSQDLQNMLDSGSLSKEDLEKMMEALKQMANAEEDARCGKSGEGWPGSQKGSVAGQRLSKLEEDIKNGFGSGQGDKPKSFSGGGTTNLAESKFGKAEGVTSEDLGTIGPNKAVKFIQEYSSKLTEVNAETRKVNGNIASGEGIVGIETEGAPEVNTVVTGEFEKVIMNLQAAAEDEVSRQNIPRKYREHLKKYFDSLREEE